MSGSSALAEGPVVGRNSKSKRDAKHRQRQRPSVWAGGAHRVHGQGTSPIDRGGSDHGGSDHGGSDHGGSDHGGSDRGGSDRGGSDTAVHDAVILGLREAADLRAAGDPAAAKEYARKFTSESYAARRRVVDAAVSTALPAVLAGIWPSGWLPFDIYQVARRRISDHAASLVADAMAADCATYAATTVDSRWVAQLEQVDAVQWWDRSQPHLTQWLNRHGVDRGTALETTVELIALLCTLPAQPVILPLPGTAHAGAHAHRGVDEKMLARVRALLAKAESTDFPEEAEALSAKAQELMSRYAIERAMLDRDREEVLLPSARRIWLEQPYLSAKSLLVAEVAAANRCRSVSSIGLGFVTVIGDELDLDIAELLTTSLMVQATTAMLISGRRVSAAGHSRTRSFRQSFLLAYARRIGERLRARAVETVALAGTELVPVFAERERVIGETFAAMFPETRRRSFSVNNVDGWAAGRAAADAAILQAERTAVRGR